MKWFNQTAANHALGSASHDLLSTAATYALEFSQRETLLASLIFIIERCLRR